jgi:hypothetical protein
LKVEPHRPELGEGLYQPLAETTRDILTYLDVRVVDEEAVCDATLAIDVVGIPLGEDYQHVGSERSSHCYTGATVFGGMALTVPQIEPLTTTITATVEPVGGTIHACPSEEQAPFQKAWAEPYLEGLVGFWGDQVLVPAMQDDDRWVHTAAADALEERGVEAVPALIEVLGNENDWARRVAATMLGEIGPEAAEAVPALVDALDDDVRPVRFEAAVALGNIGPAARGAVPALIQILRNEDGELREVAVHALQPITGQYFGEEADAWQEWWEEQQ